MADKKKLATAAVAIATAAAITLGGTFAWQSINQTALNEASDVINPGGRLHDDFDGTNKDVYVENFADEEIFARIRLEEFFEITQAGGTLHSIAGAKDTDGNIVAWETHYFDEENATDAYWDWKTGGSTVFMPTFNKNKDSLVADINGTYNGLDGVVTNADDDDRYLDYVQYVFGEKKTADAIYDYDSNDVDEVGKNVADAVNHPDHVTLVPEEHTAKYTLDATLMSMQEWIEAGSQPGEYWVYDTDGWVYWADAIQPGEATGLLLDGIKLDEKLDDSWYYAINVVAQFVTENDLGTEEDGTGFYDAEAGTHPSPEALELLKQIGAITEETSVDDPEIEQIYNMHTYVYEGTEFYGNAQYLVPNRQYNIVVHGEQNEYDDTYVTFRVTMEDGTALTAGTDYELSATKADFGAELDTEGYHHTAPVQLTILNTELVGEYVTVTAVADSTKNESTNLVSVNYEKVDINISLYDEDGNVVAGTGSGSTVAPNNEYDIVGTITGIGDTEYVIYSTLASRPVDTCLEIPSYYAHAHAGDYHEKNYVNDNGKLVVGDAETFDCNEWMEDGITNKDSLTLSIGADIVRVYENDGAMINGAEPIAIYYTYGQWDIYPSGNEKYDILMDSEIYASTQSRTADMYVLDGNDRDISDATDLSVVVSGNRDENTKIELVPETDEHTACYRLTLGAGETATSLTITAKDSNGSGSKTVTIHYLNTLKIGDSSSDQWNDIYINSYDNEKSYALDLVDYWGETVSDVTYALSGNTADSAIVEGDTLLIGAEESAWPMTLSVTEGGETTDYYVWVSYVFDDTAPTVDSVVGNGLFYTYTISGVSDGDFPMTMNVYWAETAEGVYGSGAELKYTVTYKLSDDGTVNQTGSGTEATDAWVTYLDGTVTSYVNTVVEKSGYWGVTVTDAAGNVGRLANPINVESSDGCFVAGTQVHTVNGLVNIEDIQVGDEVYSIDLNTGKKVTATVAWVQGIRFTDATYTIYAGDEQIITTHEHPFYVIGKEWLAAEELAVGDVLMTGDGEEVVIDEIIYNPLSEPIQVYNFTVDGTHNYLVGENGFLVHNLSK